MCTTVLLLKLSSSTPSSSPASVRRAASSPSSSSSSSSSFSSSSFSSLTDIPPPPAPKNTMQVALRPMRNLHTPPPPPPLQTSVVACHQTYNDNDYNYHHPPINSNLLLARQPTKSVFKKTAPTTHRRSVSKSASFPCSSLSFLNGVDLFASLSKRAIMVSNKNKAQTPPEESPIPVGSGCSGRTSGRMAKNSKTKGKPLQDTGNEVLRSPSPPERCTDFPGHTPCALVPQSSPIPAISNGLTTGEEIVAGKTRVELIRSSESGRGDLGLILAGGADKEDRLHVISIQPGSTAHRTDRILIGDYITAINGVSTLRLKQSEIMTLIGNSRHSLVFELHYRLCPTALARPLSPPRLHKGMPQPVDTGLRGSAIESKRTEVLVPRDPTSGPTCGLVLRGGARLDRDRACPVFVVQIRPGSAVHRDGGIRPGDRILAINGTDLTGLHLDDVYGLLADFHAQQSTMVCGPNHQPSPLRLLVEYDILKGGIDSSGKPTSDEWVMEFCRQSGSDIGLALSAAYIDGRHCMVVDSVRPASFADRTGIIRAGDILLSINGQNVENKMPSDVMAMLKYGSLSSTTATSPRLGSTLRLQFLRPAQPVPQPFVGGSLPSVNGLRQEASPRFTRTVGMSQSYHASLSTSGGCNSGTATCLAKRSATSVMVGAAADNTSLLGVATPTLLPRAAVCAGGRVTDTVNSSLMIPTTAVATGSQTFYQHQQPAVGAASANNSMSRLKRRGSIGSVTSFSSTCSANGGYVFHSETMDVYIEATTVAADCQPSCGGLGANFGITVQKSAAGNTTPATGTIGRSTLYNATPSKNCLTINAIEFSSPADRIGLLQEGDRILQINGHSLANKPPEIAIQLLHDSGPVCQLRVEFDVADSFAISNGVFHVRLPNRGPSLGIAAVALPASTAGTVNLSQVNGTHTSQSRVFVSDIRRGSVAYRCGNLLVGDEIISVNSCQLDSVVDLISNIQQAGEIVVLKIRRFSTHNQFFVVTYGVHFEIGDTPLGIGLARTDNPFYPFVVTLLLESGLAFRSGAVHLGDYLVAVNDLDLSGCTLQQLQDTLDSLPTDSLVVLRLCRVGGIEAIMGNNQPKPSNRQPTAPTGPTPPGTGSSGSHHDGPGRSPGAASSSDSSSGAGRSPNSNKDGGSTSSERGGHVRSVDSAICSDAIPVKTQINRPHDPIALCDLLNSALSMSRQSCYDNLKLDPTSGDWVPSTSSLASLSQTSTNRQLLAALESAIWEMDVAKLKDTTSQGLGGTNSTANNGLLLTSSGKSATLPQARNLIGNDRDVPTTRTHLMTMTPVSTTSTAANSFSSVRLSKSFGMTSPPSSMPPAQPRQILTATVASKPIYLATEHFTADRPVSGYFLASATQTEEPIRGQLAATVHHLSPALASVTSSSLLVSEDTFDVSISKQGEHPSKYIDESPVPQDCASQNGVSDISSAITEKLIDHKLAPLSTQECTDSPSKESIPPQPDSPLPDRPLEKSASTRSFRRVGDAILRRLFDRSNASPRIKREKKTKKNKPSNESSTTPVVISTPATPVVSVGN